MKALIFFLGVSDLCLYPFRHFVNDVKHSRPRAPESRAATASLKHARHRFLTLHSLLCGKTQRQSMFAERKLSSFDGAQSTRFAAFPSTHRSIYLDYWASATPKKHKPESFSEGGFVICEVPLNLCVTTVGYSARGFRIYHCFYCISRTRAQFAEFSSSLRLNTENGSL